MSETIAFSSLIANDPTKILTSIQAGTFIDELKLMSVYYGNSNFDLFRKSISIISSLCNFVDSDEVSDSKEEEFKVDKKPKTDITSLKKLSNGILDHVVAPLIKDLRESTPDFPAPDVLIKAQLLSKFWVTYMIILNHSLQKMEGIWGQNLDEWFNETDKAKISESLEVLKHFYHWKILLMRGCLLYSKPSLLLEKFLDRKQDLQFSKEIKDYLLNQCNGTLQSVLQNP